jgi:hypothetical protein
VSQLAETHLAIRPRLDASFALLPEDLALEPVELLFEGGDFLAQERFGVLLTAQGADQFDDLLGGQCDCLVKAFERDRKRQIHAVIIPRETSSNHCLKDIL